MCTSAPEKPTSFSSFANSQTPNPKPHTTNPSTSTRSPAPGSAEPRGSSSTPPLSHAVSRTPCLARRPSPGGLLILVGWDPRPNPQTVNPEDSTDGEPNKIWACIMTECYYRDTNTCALDISLESVGISVGPVNFPSLRQVQLPKIFGGEPFARPCRARA